MLDPAPGGQRGGRPASAAGSSARRRAWPAGGLEGQVGRGEQSRQGRLPLHGEALLPAGWLAGWLAS